jgi:hypothetical protein
MPTEIQSKHPYDPWCCMALMSPGMQKVAWEAARITYDDAEYAKQKHRPRRDPEQERRLREHIHPECLAPAVFVVEQVIGHAYAKLTLCLPHAVMLVGPARANAALRKRPPTVPAALTPSTPWPDRERDPTTPQGTEEP